MIRDFLLSSEDCLIRSHNLKVSPVEILIGLRAFLGFPFRVGAQGPDPARLLLVRYFLIFSVRRTARKNVPRQIGFLTASR